MDRVIYNDTKWAKQAVKRWWERISIFLQCQAGVCRLSSPSSFVLWNLKWKVFRVRREMMRFNAISSPITVSLIWYPLKWKKLFNRLRRADWLASYAAGAPSDPFSIWNVLKRDERRSTEMMMKKKCRLSSFCTETYIKHPRATREIYSWRYGCWWWWWNTNNDVVVQLDSCHVIYLSISPLRSSPSFVYVCHLNRQGAQASRAKDEGECHLISPPFHRDEGRLAF